MSETPRTDEVLNEYRLLKSPTLHYPAETALTTLARTLERDLSAARDKIARLKGRVEELEKDAARYRYLVEADPDAGPFVTVHRQDDWGNWRNDVITGVTLDAAIDAKLAALTGEEK